MEVKFRYSEGIQFEDLVWVKQPTPSSGTSTTKKLPRSAPNSNFKDEDELQDQEAFDDLVKIFDMSQSRGGKI